MKKSTFILLTMTMLAMNPMFAADNNPEHFKATFESELNISIRTDLFLAEKLLVLDIENDLISKQQLYTTANDSNSSGKSKSANLIAMNAVVLPIDTSIANSTD
jgi:hypothetical protein